MADPVILVTGANGQLCKEIKDLSAAYPGFVFKFLAKEDLSIDDAAMVHGYFEMNRPAFCINCAAYTAVDKAETDRETAMRINGHATGILADACKSNGARFIHISTDYVFDGTTQTPYREEDITDPVNFYGSTKLEGEKQAMVHNPESLVIRTSWVYSAHGSNFVKTMIRLMKERTSLNVVNDQFGSPTYAADLAAALLVIIHKTQAGEIAWQPGYYHYSNEGIISWYDFAVAIKDLTGSSCLVYPIPTSAYPTPAKRPAYSAFNKSKITASWQLSIPDWQTSLAKAILKMQGS